MKILRLSARRYRGGTAGGMWILRPCVRRYRGGTAGGMWILRPCARRYRGGTGVGPHPIGKSGTLREAGPPPLLVYQNYRKVIGGCGSLALDWRGCQSGANIVVRHLLQTGLCCFASVPKSTNVRYHSPPSDSVGGELLSNVWIKHILRPMRAWIHLSRL